MKTLLLLLLFVNTLCACTPANQIPSSGFIQPDPDIYVNLAPVVWEYFHQRKAAVLSGDMDAFHTRFPALASGADIEQGINAEVHHVAGFQSFDIVDGDVFPEYYDRIKIKPTRDTVEILVHGMELYLYRDPAGNLNQSGGEFKTILYVRPAGEGWALFQTDQVMLSEWKGFEN